MFGITALITKFRNQQRNSKWIRCLSDVGAIALRQVDLIFGLAVAYEYVFEEIEIAVCVLERHPLLFSGNHESCLQDMANRPVSWFEVTDFAPIISHSPLWKRGVTRRP